MENLAHKVKTQVEDFLTDTYEARSLSERDRDYKDHKQWSEYEISKLLGRKQAPVVVNRIRPKVEGLIGLYALRHTDPKAFPRTKKHEDSAHAITDALRYVADKTGFEHIKLDVADEYIVEGYGGVIVKTVDGPDGLEIEVSQIPWDRIYYDPHSRMRHFDDARYKGMMVWLDEEQVLEWYPKADISQLYTNGDITDETFEDKPRWSEKERKRIRLAVHFFIKDGVWHYCVFSGDYFLVEPTPSPFLDEDGTPTCPIELVSCNIDRNNNRYGEVRGWISQQDEINHRRSKALHLLSQRQTFGRKGEVKDVQAIKRELAKPDGHVEFIGETFGKDFGILPTSDMAQGQFDLYMDAKSELDAVGYNAQLAGERQMGDLSGKAIDKLQQAGTVELNRCYNTLAEWEKRVYRQIWGRIRQAWTAEKWIRITDDQDNLKWVGLNYQTTTKEWLEEQINDEALPLQNRRALAATYQFLTQAAAGPDQELMQAAQQGNPQAIFLLQKAIEVQPVAQAKLEEIIEVKNNVAELDVDIILDQSFDVINAQQEQFNALVQFAQKSQDIDITELLELSNVRGKDEIIEKIEKRRAAAAQAAGNVQQLQAQSEQAKIAELQARAQKLGQEAMQKQIENQVMLNGKASVEVAKSEADIAKSQAETTQKNLENLLLMYDPDRVTHVSV